MRLGNLLIVDDEELLVKNISFLLKKYAENIFVAFNGVEAFEVIQKHPIHCVICDISMPKMTGLEFLQKVRDSGNEVPFIFYTAYAQPEIMMKAAEYGAFDFLRKPDFESLIESITRGIAEGFKRENKTGESGKENDYDKLLQDLNKLL